MSQKKFIIVSILLGAFIFWVSCISDGNSFPDKPQIIEEPTKMDFYVSKGMSKLLQLELGEGVLYDSVKLRNDSLVMAFYQKSGFLPYWSFEGQSHPIADSLLVFVDQSLHWGLFPSDYHQVELDGINDTFRTDSSRRKDAVLWAKRDLLLTDAFFQIVHDIKLGRLERDSITLAKDSVLTLAYFEGVLKSMKDSLILEPILQTLEPRHPGYDSLKFALKSFLDSNRINSRPPTFVQYRTVDSLLWVKQAGQRLIEIGMADSSLKIQDTGLFKKAIRDFQKDRKLKVTGRIDFRTVDKLNSSPEQKFRIIALNLDRFKHLPDTMPKSYIWVNIPSFYLQVWEKDSLLFISRVVVGKPETRTPLLTSRLTEIITYPQWTIPNSIVMKEVIPGIKKKADYLSKHNYIVVNAKGQEMDPKSIAWSSYKKTFPYKIVQGSGDDNALGILKFNFSNRYSVYMHDTNQRYLFSNPDRSMSHGCVRVQEWEKLAHFLLKGDTLKVRRSGDSLAPSNPSLDSLKAWLKRKEKHYLPVRNRMPVFIRYFTCDGKNGRVRFFEDIYGEDRMLLEKFYLRNKEN